jgi:two-component system response regulator TtrR
MDQIPREDQHVWVIDEDASSRNGLLRLLRVAGYTVKAYECAADFLVDFDLCHSGCIILDADLTGMSGDDLMSQVTALGSDLPVIIISSSDDQALKRESWIAQAKGFYRKPVDARALIDTIDWLLISSREKARIKTN